MVKNNIYSVGIQIIMTIIFLSITKINVSIIGSGLAIFSYIAFGYLFLSDRGTVRKNFCSVSFIVIIGILIWAFCFINTNYKEAIPLYNINVDSILEPWYVDHDLIWRYYETYIDMFLIIIYPLKIILVLLVTRHPVLTDIFYFIFLLIPSFLLCLGIKIRSIKTKATRYTVVLLVVIFTASYTIMNILSASLYSSKY